jgi:hypothetical protein
MSLGKAYSDAYSKLNALPPGPSAARTGLEMALPQLQSAYEAASKPGMKKGGFVPPFAKKGGSSHKMPNGKMMKNSAMSMGGKANFEKSGKDVEKKGMKEGSKADMALDKKQMMGMKKGGMPMKDGKPAFMMKKKMMGGGGVRGNSGYVGMGKKENAIDGSSTAGENTKIQKKGLTEGRTIKMASGGSVDGIAQRGKTRGKMC